MVKSCWKRMLIVVVVFLFGAYLAVYLGLSRRGYDEADRSNMVGFYYFPPEESEAWRFQNEVCVWPFFPINAVDRWLGLGRHPATEPLWRIEGHRFDPAVYVMLSR